MADDTTKIEIAKLAKAVECVLTELESWKGSRDVTIQPDYYWAVSRDEMFCLDKEPSQHTLGSLSENIAAMRDLAVRGDIVPEHFVWLGQIMIAIGYTFSFKDE